MAKTKRAHEDDDIEAIDHVHPSRTKRLKYSEEDVQLAKIYNELADEVQAVRIKAAGELIKVLSTTGSDQKKRLNDAETRLIKGLCSGRKAARLGFSIALPELFRLEFKTSSGNDITILRTIDKITKLTTPQGNVSGQEKRDYFLGRRFAFQAILQSDVALNKELPDDEWRRLIQAIFALAAEKPWLRKECGGMLFEYLTSSTGTKLDTLRVQAVVQIISDNKQWRTPEGVGLWITIQERFPGVKLPKGIWHHRKPLSSKEGPVLSKVLLENAVDDESPNKRAGSRQSRVGFVWTVILSQLYQCEDEKPLAKFWDICVASAMFSTSASAERKSFGLQIFTLALSSAPHAKLSAVIHSNIVHYIMDQRVNPERYLFESATTPLNQMITRSKLEPGITGILVPELITKGAATFDHLTKTKIVESMISNADDNSLTVIVNRIAGLLDDADTQPGTQMDTRCRTLADLLLMMVRSHKDARQHIMNGPQGGDHVKRTWLGIVLKILIKFAYGELTPSARQHVFRSRLMSSLNCLMDSPLKDAINGPVFVAMRAFRAIPDLKSADERAKKAMRRAQSYLRDSLNHRTGESSLHAFSLLFALSILQVYNEETDAVSVLEDLITCYQTKDESNDSIMMLIELLLSFVSRPSALFRKLAEQVFATITGELTPDSLQSLIEILNQNESLTGQRELFAEDAEDGALSNSGAESGSEADLEGLSDVELVNGFATSGLNDGNSIGSDEDDDDADESSSSAEVGGGEEDDEEAVFDKKLADALGTAGIEGDSDDDGSDMDDEQMMALEPHLTSIFKERQQKTSKKQDKKDAKNNIVNFKNRVLDLLTIYVKSQYASVVALDLIIPLTTLVRTTGSSPTAAKAFAVLKQYFDACTKHKTLPQPEGREPCFEVLSAVHEEMKLVGSKLHANACSRSSLFLSKVLLNLAPTNYERIAGMYAKLQCEWYLEPKSKIHGSVFTEWTSWSLATKKQI